MSKADEIRRAITGRVVAETLTDHQRHMQVIDVRDVVAVSFRDTCDDATYTRFYDSIEAALSGMDRLYESTHGKRGTKR